MNKFKIFAICTFSIITLMCIPNNVSALENNEDLIKRLAPDGKNAVLKMKKPTSITEGDFNINGYVNSIIQEKGYYVQAACLSEPYTDCEVSIETDDYESEWDGQKEIPKKGWKGVYDITVTYDEPEPNATVADYIGKLNNFSANDPTTYYIVEDLSLINYYLTSSKSELWNIGAAGRALKYSTINKITGNSNITYYLDVRAGIQNENLMFESAFGPISVFYNGYSYATKDEGLYLKRVIYIPESTIDSKDAYIEAAQKRINEYLGNESVKVSYGGLLSSLDQDSEDIDFPITSDGNYYNIKVGSKTYKFYIVKGSNDKLVEPIYLGTDIKSNIKISSNDSSIPLDTALNVKDVTSNISKDVIGTDNFKSYDISLYSDAKEAKIQKLENGKFLVKIPIPKELNGKELIVYYINESGNKEEHNIIIENGYAVFETNHFSTYTLAEHANNNVQNAEITKLKNPQTGDNIIIYFVISIISLFIFMNRIIYIKK